jgi:CheY-like chemotaxis protein
MCTASRTGRKPRILLIEDDPDAGELMVELLQLRGYPSELCAEADKGLRRWQEQRHEVVISDINLRRESGLRIAESLAAEPAKPVLIALSGQLDQSAKDRSRAAGFDHHIAKPIELDAFESLLARCGRAWAAAE